MNIKNIIFFALATIFFVSCSRYPKDVEDALRLAGDHRAELEKALEYYRGKDELKYRAAEYLIAGMPARYSTDDRPTDAYQPLFDDWLVLYKSGKVKDKVKTFDSLVSKHRLFHSYKVLPDVKHVTAEYLINNIERAFEVWTETPWGKNVPFDAFCEEILPYRLGTEPLENWRDIALEKYRAVYDSLRNTDSDAPAACAAVIDAMGRYFYPPFDHTLPEPSFSMIDKFRTGGCPEQVAIAVFTMRALGIPVTSDETPQWPHRSKGHGWNTVRDKDGNHIVFYFMETKPGESHMSDYKRAKVFRKTWRRNPESLALLARPGEIVPNFFQNPCMIDISHESYPTVDVTFTRKQLSGKSDHVYLSVFDNTQWVPVCWTKRDNPVVFHAMGKDIVYLPVAFDQNNMYACGPAFLLTKEGEVCPLAADTARRQTVKLMRKYPFFLKHWAKMTGGKFQGADRPDFSDSVTLYTIPGVPEMYFQDIVPENPQPYRYYRYLGPPHGSCNIAELEFYTGDEGNQRIVGKMIGAAGSFDNDPKRTFDKAFDGDILTFYHALNWSGDWTGMDFGKKEKVTKIRYLPRNDDNTVAVGQTYELFYWDNGWRSLGRQIPTEQVLYYDNAPGNALFLLRNLTKGNEERIFTYEDGKQIWW